MFWISTFSAYHTIGTEGEYIVRGNIWWLKINLLDDFNNISSHVWHVILFRSWFVACRLIVNIHCTPSPFTFHNSMNSNHILHSWWLYPLWSPTCCCYCISKFAFPQPPLFDSSRLQPIWQKSARYRVVSKSDSPAALYVAINDPWLFRNSSQYFIWDRQNNTTREE